MEFVHKKGLTRAVTFDDRKRENHGGGFTRLSKRAQTFVGKTVSEKNAEDRPLFPDIIYRRYFGMEGHNTPHIPPLNQNKAVPLDHSVTAEAGPSQITERDAVVVVDTFSTAAILASRLYHMGYKVICVLSGDLKDLLAMMPEGVDLVFEATFVFNTDQEPDLALATLINQIRSLDLDVRAVFAGAETGVELADQLSEQMHLRTNGTALSEARRNKYVMGETVRSAGIRAVKQLKATSWGEIEEWIEAWNPDPFKVIVKPMDSAGSDDVTLCHNLEDVKRAFGNIMGKVNGLGIVNRAVLVQEYLEGDEYVIDMVSRDGEHKVMGIWVYDRRAVNGAGFVCFGQKLLTINDEHCQELVEYQKKVITALGIKNGPTHGEVKWCRGEPVLVEVGARCHGGDGLWVQIAEECYGYSQVQGTILSYLDEAKFRSLPPVPSDVLAYGRLKWLINYKAGTFNSVSTAGLEDIKALGSYRGHQIFFAPGKKVHKTKDCFTWGGCAMLANKSKEVLQADYSRIEQLENSDLFDVDVIQEPVGRSLVAVVDPFSTGAVLAADLAKTGYGIVAVYSAKLEQLANLQNLVPAGLTIVFESIIAYDEINVMVDQLRSCGEIVAIFAGAETGVELADQLSEQMHLRTNGTALSEARRNKYVMGETVRSAGIRAVKQLKATSWGEIEEWIEAWNPDPFKVIVKPMDSAGSDDVTLCHNLEDVKRAFGNIMGKVNGLGIVNRAVLVQEYLEGDEYVIDMVSRDGEHKVMGIWVYDRRAVNGAGFVCFGQKLLTINDEHCQELVEYQKKVITALGIKNGPTHGEVKWCRGEPVLVEVGARCHGVEGMWQIVANYGYGYNQVQGTIDSYLNSAAFNAYPSAPTVLRNYGRMLFLIAFDEGVLKEVDPSLLEEIRRMQSVVGVDLLVKPGTYVYKTIDCFTFGGVIRLVNEDLSQLERDYNRIREMEKSGLFVFEE
eukprot:gene7202-7968_t